MSALIPVQAAAQLPRAAAPQNDVWRRLLAWQHSGQQLTFVYTRSLGGLVQTGQGKLAHLSPEAMSIETAGSKLLIMLSNALYEAGPQLFFTPNLLSRFHVDGIAVRLANHDWLFLSDQSMPAHAAIGMG